MPRSPSLRLLIKRLASSLSPALFRSICAVQRFIPHGTLYFFTGPARPLPLPLEHAAHAPACWSLVTDQSRTPVTSCTGCGVCTHSPNEALWGRNACTDHAKKHMIRTHRELQYDAEHVQRQKTKTKTQTEGKTAVNTRVPSNSKLNQCVQVVLDKEKAEGKHVEKTASRGQTLLPTLP